MKHTRFVGMALISLFILSVGPSLGLTLTSAGGFDDSSTSGNGYVDGAASYTSTADTSYLATVWTLAGTDGIGTAFAKYVDRSVGTNDELAAYQTDVDAETVYAQVEGTTTDTEVAAMSKISSEVSSDATSGETSGVAKIESTIGKTETGTAGAITGSAEGDFTAATLAKGSASYTATTTNTITGSVDGETSLTADVSDGILSGLQDAYINAGSSSTYLTSTDALSAESANKIGLDSQIPFSSGSVSGDVSTIAGTVEGDAKSDAVSAENKVTSATTDAILSADTSVSTLRDSAQAISELSATASYTLATGVYDVTSLADTNVDFERHAKGTTGHSESFITSGNWNAASTMVTSQTGASVSGALSEIEGSNGIGAGTFLNYAKTQPAEAESVLMQESKYTDAATDLYYTKNYAKAYINGPKASGASTSDGAGVYGAYSGLTNNVIVDNVDKATAYIDSIDSMLWVDGTNSGFYNGYGFDVPTQPTFTGLTGTISGPTWTKLSSSSDRKTTVEYSTIQSSS